MEGLTLEGCQDPEEICSFLTEYHRIGNICGRKKCWALLGSPIDQHFILLQLCSLTGLMEGRGQSFCKGSGPFYCLLCSMGFSPNFRAPGYVPDREVENKFYCRVVEASLPQWFSAPQLPHYLFFKLEGSCFIMLVSTVQQHESAISIHISPPSLEHIFF